MGYYLSKQNEGLLQTFLPILKQAKDSITLETNDPDRLVYILRNAANLPNYNWLKIKFIFSKKNNTVVCKIRNTTVCIVDGIKSIDNNADLVYIVNYIIQEKPTMVKFTNAPLTETEYERLEAYCATNQYSVSKENNNITIIKN